MDAIGCQHFFSNFTSVFEGWQIREKKMKGQTPIYLLAIPIINIYHPYKDESHSFYAYANALQKLPPLWISVKPLVRTFWIHFSIEQGNEAVTKTLFVCCLGDEILPNLKKRIIS